MVNGVLPAFEAKFLNYLFPKDEKNEEKSSSHGFDNNAMIFNIHLKLFIIVFNIHGGTDVIL